MTTAISVCGINRPLGRSATILAPTYRFCASSDPMEPLIISDVGIIVMPGGGYNELIDKDEQTPVAEYFAQKFGITTFVLYYRLVQTNGTYRYPFPCGMRNALSGLSARMPQSMESVPSILESSDFLRAAISPQPSPYTSIRLSDCRLKMVWIRRTLVPIFMGLGYPVISMDPNQYASQNSLRHLLGGYKGTELTQLEQYLSGQEQANKTTPPAFLFESWDDAVISSQNSSLFLRTGTRWLISDSGKQMDQA